MCRYAFVDVSDPQRENAFEEAMRVLERGGWKQGKGPGQIQTVDWSVAIKAEAPFVIVRCETREQAQTANAVLPDAFEMVRGFGAAEIELALAESVKAAPPVDRVIIGFNWTLVRAGDLCGIARSPSRDTEGARTIRPESGFVGRSLRDLAQYLKSMDPLQRALGLAAVNAYWNRTDPPNETVGYLSPRGGLASIEAPGNGAIIVGGFRGALQRLPEARIVEREPKDGDIPADEAAAAYAEASILAITAQTLMNGSLAPILSASDMVPYRLLVGPSCPACPVLFNYGLDEVFGAVIIDPDAAETFILESGTMIMLDHIATSRTLRAIPPGGKTPP